MTLEILPHIRWGWPWVSRNPGELELPTCLRFTLICDARSRDFRRLSSRVHRHSLSFSFSNLTDRVLHAAQGVPCEPCDCLLPPNLSSSHEQHGSFCSSFPNPPCDEFTAPGPGCAVWMSALGVVLGTCARKVGEGVGISPSCKLCTRTQAFSYLFSRQRYQESNWAPKKWVKCHLCVPSGLPLSGPYRKVIGLDV